jgi:hypothetical protein
MGRRWIGKANTTNWNVRVFIGCYTWLGSKRLSYWWITLLLEEFIWL